MMTGGYRIPRKASPNRAMIQATSPHRARLERFTKVRIYCKSAAMKTKRAYKEQFYPTPEQEKLLAQSFGGARFVYNNTLRFRTDAYYKDGKSVSQL